MNDGIGFIAFTDPGESLANRLQSALGGTVTRSSRGAGFSLRGWTETAFSQYRALIFVGAVGITVRAIAPYLTSKACDPAVVAVDEQGRFAVPVLSGHLGGANDLAREISRICGAVPVITTATDIRGVFAVDEWARRQNCAVANPDQIKVVTSRVLTGKTVKVWSAIEIEGTPPEGVDLTERPEEAHVLVDVNLREEPGLHLIPRGLVLGVGCRKGVAPEALESAFSSLCREQHIQPEAVDLAATIDLKEEEPGLRKFCMSHGWDLRTFTARELAAVPGDFSSSAFVLQTTGVDNVCERAAVFAAGGLLMVEKQAGDGVTMALARMPFWMDWRWRE